MRFLIDANMPRQTANVLRDHGHEAVDVRDLNIGQAPDEQIAALARSQSLCIISRDFDFGDVRKYPPAEHHGLVVIDLPPTAHARLILRVVESFLSLKDVINALPGRLAVVSPGQVRLRPSSQAGSADPV